MVLDAIVNGFANYGLHFIAKRYRARPDEVIPSAPFGSTVICIR